MAGDDEAGHPDVSALLRPEDARVLYGRGSDEGERLRVLAALERAARERDEAAAIVAPADGAVEPEHASADEQSDEASPPAPQETRSRRPRAALIGATAALAGALVLAGGYALGSGRSSGGSKPAAAPAPTALPTVLYLDDRDGEVVHLAYAQRGDARTAMVTLPEMVSGWSLATACLSRDSTPRSVPTETVVLLDGAGRQLGSWTVPCDTAERRYFAIPAPARPTIVQLLLVFDDQDVRAAWATIDPNR